MHNYHDARGSFPVGFKLNADMGGGRWGNSTNWRIDGFPYFDQENLYRRWDYNDYGNNVAGGMSATTAQLIKVLLCPSDPLPDPVVYWKAASQRDWLTGFYGMSSYHGNQGKRSAYTPQTPPQTTDGIFFQDRPVRIPDITDGTSNTLLLGERYHRDPEFDRIIEVTGDAPIAVTGLWAFCGTTPPGPGAARHATLSSPVAINYQVPPSATMGDVLTIVNRLCAYGSGHPGGANFAFADGRVRFLSDQIDLTTLQALSTRAGGEPISGNDY
jgi:prepilin-type processing-associated H-X9-DG protein